MFGSGVQQVHSPPEQFNQSVPFARHLDNFVQPKRIRIVGVVQQHARQFIVNIKDRHGNILLHYNPRFNENCVVRNNCHRGQWNHEERHGGFPFRAGQMFTLDLLAEPNSVHIRVNGEDHCEFYHRESFHLADQLEVEGDLEDGQLHMVSLKTEQ